MDILLGKRDGNSLSQAGAACNRKNTMASECLIENPCLGVNVPRSEAQEILKPQCILIHEDFEILQQRRRWVSFRPHTYSFWIKENIM